MFDSLFARNTPATAALLAKARADLEAAEAKIESFGRDRQAVIASDVDIAGVLAIDRNIVDEERLRAALGERIECLELRLVEEAKERREHRRDAAAAILEIVATEYAALQPPLDFGRYIERAPDGVVLLVKQLLERSGRHVAHERTGLDFITRANAALPYEGGYVGTRLKRLTDFVADVDLDRLYGPIGEDVEEVDAEQEREEAA